MSDFVISGRQFNPTTVVKLDKGLERRAMESAKTDGADNIFFQVNDDTYVASAESMSEIRDVKIDNLFKFEGEKARVIAIDDEYNCMTDAFDAAKGLGSGILAAGGVWSGLLFGVASTAPGGSVAEAAQITGKHALGAVAIAATVGVGIAAISAINFATKDIDLQRMTDYGQSIPLK